MKTFSLSVQYNVPNKEVPNCMKEITSWMNNQFLKLNPDKTEMLLLYPKSMKHKVIIKGTIFEDQCMTHFKIRCKFAGQIPEKIM